jgi:LmbE family N-acetylglucosaminyl deacetylase
VYLQLPDGELSSREAELTSTILDVLGWVEPSRIFTMGSSGYDGHLDHIVAHSAAVGAAASTRQLAGELVICALTADHTGELWVAGDTGRKLGAIAMHVSQTVVPDLVQWGGTDIYEPLIKGAETYTPLC